MSDTKSTRLSLRQARAEIEMALSELSVLFEDHCRVTFIMRNPQADDGNLIIGNDRLDDVRDAVADMIESQAEAQ